MTSCMAPVSITMRMENWFTVRNTGTATCMVSSFCTNMVRRLGIINSGMALSSSSISGVVLGCLWIVCGSANGQTMSDVERGIRETYPDRSAVFVEQSTTLTLSIEEDSLKAYSDVFED